MRSINLQLRGPGVRLLAVWRCRWCACLPHANSHHRTGCTQARLWELLLRRLPIAGITTLVEQLRRAVWAALLRKPGAVVRFIDDQCVLSCVAACLL